MTESQGRGPLVSIGLPTYNRPGLLREALAALVAQTHANLEIIVSDNASPDPAVQEVIREFAARDARIRAFRQPQNLGFLPTVRFVYEQARGEYFMWAADDDLCDPEFVETCLANLTNPENRAVLAFCHVRKRRADGSIVDPDFADPVGSTSRSLLRRSFRYLYHSGGNHAFYGLYRRSVINEWFFARRFGNDHLALLTVLRHGNIHVDPRVLFTSTIGGAGFERVNFHRFYEDRRLKVFVNLSSTLAWWYEFLRCIWITPYKAHEKVLLSLFTVARFARPRYWKRFAGDMLALLTRRDIWNFGER
jgi:glycosyltransferase involved in cell wall biosynthesis